MKGWALYYASLGWHVFPLVPGQKTPWCKKGSTEATTDTAKIEAWWDASPNSGIGMSPAPSGMVVLDMDPRNGGVASFDKLQQDHGLVLSPLMAQSGRGEGFHLYFQAREGAAYAPNPQKLPGLDGKWRGYVVLPPSTHPDTGNQYQWLTGLDSVVEPLPEAPACMEREIREPKPERVKREVSPAELPTIKQALSFLDASDNAVWVGTMASMEHWGRHADCDADAFEAFCEWSDTSEKSEHHGNEDEIHDRWISWKDKGSDLRTIGSVFHEAKLKGFKLSVDAKAAFDLAQQLIGVELASDMAEALNSPKPVEHVPGKFEPLSELKVAPTPTMNDHLWDAGTLRDSVEVFRNHLGSFEGSSHWWNGRCWEPAPDAELRRLLGIAMASTTIKSSSGRIKGTLEVMQDQLPRYGQVDPASRTVFFENGALNPVTGEITEHAPANCNSRVLSVAYDPLAACAGWEAWLADIFRTEPQRAELLQEMMGWTLCRHHLGIEKAMILIGPPRSGKGTILRVIRELLGTGAGAFALPTLDDNKVLAGMRGENVSIDSDTSSPGRNNARQIVGLFKRISSNEDIAVPLLYTQRPWKGPLNCKLILAANSIPTMWDDSAATANRWVPLAFDRSFLDREDQTLASRLVQELPGIAMWAVKGLQRLISNGRFTLPQSSRDELVNMISSGSPIEHFISDRLIVADGQRVSDADLWGDYIDWQQKEGLEQMKRRDFLKALEDALRGRGVKRKASVRINNFPLRGFEGASIVTEKIVNINRTNS